MSGAVSQLADAIPRGGRVAVGDGAGFPNELWPVVVGVAAERPDVKVLLGLCLGTPQQLDTFHHERAVTVISGFGLRRASDAGQVGFAPARLGCMPGLLSGSLRPDVLITTLRPVGDGFAFTTEVSWQRA